MIVRLAMSLEIKFVSPGASFSACQIVTSTPKKVPSILKSLEKKRLSSDFKTLNILEPIGLGLSFDRPIEKTLIKQTEITFDQRGRPRPTRTVNKFSQDQISAKMQKEMFVDDCEIYQLKNLLLNNFQSHPSAVIEEFCDIPDRHSSDLKNTVNEILFSLGNQIDRHTCCAKTDYLSRSTLCTCTGSSRKRNLGGLDFFFSNRLNTNSVTEKKMFQNLIHDKVMNESLTKLSTCQFCSTHPLVAHSLLGLTRSIEENPNKQTLLHNLLNSVVSSPPCCNMRQQFLEFAENCAVDEVDDFANSSEAARHTGIAIYPELLEKTIMVIDSMKLRIEQLEGIKTCRTCQNLHNNTIVESEIPKYNSDFIEYENENKIKVLQRENADQKQLIKELTEMLNSRESQFKKLQGNFSTLLKHSDYLKEFQEDKLDNKSDKSNKNKISHMEKSLHGGTEKLSASFIRENQYQHLLKEHQDYTFAQIYEYKKAVRHLKNEIARMQKPVIPT